MLKTKQKLDLEVLRDIYSPLRLSLQKPESDWATGDTTRKHQRLSIYIPVGLTRLGFGTVKHLSGQSEI